MNNRLLIYVHYNKNDNLSEHVVYQISKIRSLYDKIVFVSNSRLDDYGVDKIKTITDVILQRSNTGYDFAAWRDGLNMVGWGEIKKSYNSITLMNDTCFGPLYDLEDVYGYMDLGDNDFWGMTDHAFSEKGMPGTDLSIPRHIQSYFMVFNKKVIMSKSFCDFWNNVKDYTDVFKVIQNYETRLTSLLNENGFKDGVFFNTHKYRDRFTIETPNYSEMQPLIIIKQKVPFVKIKSFIWTEKGSILKEIKKSSNYPTKLIDLQLKDRGIKYIHSNPGYKVRCRKLLKSNRYIMYAYGKLKLLISKVGR